MKKKNFLFLFSWFYLHALKCLIKQTEMPQCIGSAVHTFLVFVMTNVIPIFVLVYKSIIQTY